MIAYLRRRAGQGMIQKLPVTRLDRGPWCIGQSLRSGRTIERLLWGAQ